MSRNSKLHKAQREARQEKQARKVIKWIFIVLVIMAAVFIGTYIANM